MREDEGEVIKVIAKLPINNILGCERHKEYSPKACDGVFAWYIGEPPERTEVYAAQDLLIY